MFDAVSGEVPVRGASAMPSARAGMRFRGESAAVGVERTGCCPPPGGWPSRWRARSAHAVRPIRGRLAVVGLGVLVLSRRGTPRLRASGAVARAAARPSGGWTRFNGGLSPRIIRPSCVAGTSASARIRTTWTDSRLRVAVDCPPPIPEAAAQAAVERFAYCSDGTPDLGDGEIPSTVWTFWWG